MTIVSRRLRGDRAGKAGYDGERGGTMRKHGLFLAGVEKDGQRELPVFSPFDGRQVATVALGGAEELEAAAEAAALAARRMEMLPAWKRAEILTGAAGIVRDRREQLAEILVEEAGKPQSLALGEVDRCVDTLMESASIARHPEIAARELGGYAAAEGRLAMIRRVSVGPVFAITPFNFPLNLVAHKLGPAIAAGCPVLLKPASQTPGAALALAGILHEAGLPAGALSVIPSRGSDAQHLAGDERFGLLSFTGSMDVGWKLKQLAWRRRVGLELGGNAAVIVDDESAGIEEMASRIVGGAFSFAGQSCISVQRILIHEDLYLRMRRALVEAAEAFPAGDPGDAVTLCGPVIDDANAERIESWVAQAEDAGGRRLCGGGREGRVLRPVLLEEVPSSEPVVSREVFGPVAVLEAYEDFQQAMHMVNDSRFGLQLGVFSRDLEKIQMAWEEAEVGGVIQGDIPTWRSDPMPYGGVKQSGTGREGPLYAWREMTEERLLVLRRT